MSSFSASFGTPRKLSGYLSGSGNKVGTISQSISPHNYFKPFKPLCQHKTSPSVSVFFFFLQSYQENYLINQNNFPMLIT